MNWTRPRRQTKKLELRLIGRQAEDPARKVRIDELQGQLKDGHRKEEPRSRTAQTLSQAKEAQLAAIMVTTLETRVEDLNVSNLALSENHRQDRTQVTEQQSRLRTLGRRERELAKQLDFIANKLNEAIQLKVQEGEAGLADHTDFRNLPGLRLNKLTHMYNNLPPMAATASEPNTHPSTPSNELQKSGSMMLEDDEQDADLPSDAKNTPTQKRRHMNRAGTQKLEGKNCGKCGNTFMDDSSFCRKCGEARAKPANVMVVQPRCGDCGNLLMEDSNFCRKCGKEKPKPEETASPKESEQGNPGLMSPPRSPPETAESAEHVRLAVEDAAATVQHD